MSKSRENVTFQSADGTWGIGFFTFFEVHNFERDEDEDFDEEWDVEYSYDSFWFASLGHRDDDAAYEAFCRAGNANPGGTTIIDYTPENAAEIARYEQLAQKLTEELKAERANRKSFSYSRTW